MNSKFMLVKIKDITDFFESIAPLSLQESYDNSGLIIGCESDSVDSALVTIDVTEEVIDEAIEKKTGLIIAHHPVIFSGLKKITGKSYVERIIIKAIKNNIAIYAAHTNLDSITGGVNAKIGQKLGLLDCRILQPNKGMLKKLVTFVPVEKADEVKQAVFKAGAGNIGNYDFCGFITEGKGSFRGNEATNPYVGAKNEIHIENEIRFETIFPAWLQNKVIKALIQSHPYEEVAYDIYSLENKYDKTGFGMMGNLPDPMEENDFLNLVKTKFNCEIIRHSPLLGKKVNKIAVCGGSGSFLINQAISENADFLITGDLKYHQFFDADNQIVLADIGHFESEQFTKELFYELVTKKFPTFAVRFSEVNTNPVLYF